MGKDKLLADMRSHSYTQNPAFGTQFSERRLSIDEVKRQQNNYEEQVSALKLEAKDLQLCCICHTPAINPMKCCAKPMVSPEEQNPKPPESLHVFCYQCITNYMRKLGKRAIDCPYCRVNKIDLAHLDYADITVPQTIEVYCSNLCGLRGTTTAMAHHICPYQSRKMSGHTLQSLKVQNLEDQEEELRDNTERCWLHCRVWFNKFEDMQKHYNKLMNEGTKLNSQLVEAKQVINSLEKQISELESQTRQLAEDIRQTLRNREYIKKFSQKLKTKCDILEKTFGQHLKQLGIKFRPNRDPDTENGDKTDGPDLTLDGIQRSLDRTENNWKSTLDLIVSDYKIRIIQLEEQLRRSNSLLTELSTQTGNHTQGNNTYSGYNQIVRQGRQRSHSF